jgi:hypothetical protein
VRVVAGGRGRVSSCGLRRWFFLTNPSSLLLSCPVYSLCSQLSTPPASADSVVPWIATELSVGALVLVVAILWTTLDMDQRYEVTPLNLQEWVAMVKEEGYLFNLMDYYIFGSGI